MVGAEGGGLVVTIRRLRTPRPSELPVLTERPQRWILSRRGPQGLSTESMEADGVVACLRSILVDGRPLAFIR